MLPPPLLQPPAKPGPLKSAKLDPYPVPSFTLTHVADLVRIDIEGVFFDMAGNHTEGRFCTMMTRATALQFAKLLAQYGAMK